MAAPRNGLGFRIALAVTLALLGARLTGAPPISDPVGGAAPEWLHLSVPVLYLVFAPVFTLWDGISMLSLSRLKGFLLGLAILYLFWRTARWLVRPRGMRRWPRAILGELGVLGISTVLLLGFLILGALWHRPMLSLGGSLPEDKVVDFHSHTNASHDVSGTLMESFNAAANRRWHQRAGFDVAFITDHNTVEGWEKRDRGPGTGDRGLLLCPGLEVSAWRAHIVLLGDTMPVDRGSYNSSLAGLLDLLEDSESRFGALTLASLPEYRRNHWSRLDTLVAAGLDGFEIVNASPKANELTRAERDSVISLARVHNLFVAGVSDSHGWGATSMVWNLVQVPPAMPSSGICGAILSRLHDGFPAVRIYERHRLRPDAWWPLWLTPVGVLWETWRGMDWPLTVAWLVWIWVFGAVGRLVVSRLRKKAAGANIAQGAIARHPSTED